MKIRKKQVRHIRLSIVILFLAVIIYIFTNLFVGVANVSLSYEIQEKQNKIAKLKDENSKLELEISKLEEKERIYDVAYDTGLSLNQNNVISIRR